MKKLRVIGQNEMLSAIHKQEIRIYPQYMHVDKYWIIVIKRPRETVYGRKGYTNKDALNNAWLVALKHEYRRLITIVE